MKKRITALLLVLVMAATLLCSCDYKYEKKDFGKYADPIDAAALKTALTNIVIEDEDFTADEDTRKAKALAALKETFAGYFDGGEAFTDGAIGDYDKVTLRFYIQMNKNSQEDVVADDVYSLDTVKKNSAASFATTDALLKQIYEALQKKGEDLRYSAAVVSATDVTTIKADATLTENDINEKTKLKSGDLVFVTYTESTDGAGAVQKTEWIDVPAENDGTFAGALFGKEIGTTFASATTEAIEIGGSKYYKITPVFVAGEANECKITLPEETKLTDAFGTTKTFVKGAGGTAYVFVTERYRVPDVANEENRETVLRTLLENFDYAKSKLDIFSSEEYAYKYKVVENEVEVEKKLTLKQIFDCLISRADKDKTGDATNAVLITEALNADLLKGKYEAYTEAKAAYDEENAKEDPNQDTLKELKDKMDKAAEEYNDADLWYECTFTMILQAGKVKEETEKDVMTAIYDAFYNGKYDELKSEYEDAIYKKVATAVDKILNDAIKVNKAPKTAVRQAYNNNIDAYRYEYYAGDSAETNQKNYKTVELFLQAQATTYLRSKDASAAAVTTRKGRKEALRAQAEEQVKKLETLYLTADALNEAFGCDLKVTKDAKLEYASAYLWYYQYLYSYYGYDTSSMTVENVMESLIADSGETNYNAMVMDNLISTFLYKTKEGGGNLDFVNIHYTATAKAD